ncbi:MAG: IS982 family transposase, partial [Planctomycetota bacterium]|nr:IS982 family transposase [Planctomycetota bacterium]
QLPPERRPGPPATLSRSEVVALALFGQWARFASEGAFYRYADQHLRAAFPTLPHRAQLNRLLRTHHDAIVAFGLDMGAQTAAGRGVYEALDTLGVPTRNLKRRGRGWLVGQVDIGWSNRLGWYEGFHLLCRPPTAHAPLARCGPARTRPLCGGSGLRGHEQSTAVAPLCPGADHLPPKRNSRQPWSKRLRRWLAGLRQIVETVNDKLLYTFRLSRERPHDVTGFQARLAAMVGLHNFCIWLNEHLGRPRLAFAELLDW